MLSYLIIIPLWLPAVTAYDAVVEKALHEKNDVMKSADINTKAHFIKSMISFLSSKAPMEPVKMEKLEKCGCASAPAPIKFGNGIGVQCVRDSEAEFDGSCGALCMNHKDEQLVSFCPVGFQPNCEKGCELNEYINDETDPEALLEKLDMIIWRLAQNLEPHMIEAFHTPMTEKKCGCAQPLTNIEFGSKFGYQCIRHEPGHPEALYDEACGPNCQDANKSDLILFCPPGWKKDCQEGCTWKFGINTSESLNRMIEAITGIMAHFKDAFPDPSTQAVLDCGCENRPATFGMGKACGRNAELIFDDTKCTGVRCTRETIDSVIFCPKGFVGNCKEGCTLEFSHDEL